MCFLMLVYSIKVLVALLLFWTILCRIISEIIFSLFPATESWILINSFFETSFQTAIHLSRNSFYPYTRMLLSNHFQLCHLCFIPFRCYNLIYSQVTPRIDNNTVDSHITYFFFMEQCLIFFWDRHPYLLSCKKLSSDILNYSQK